MRERRAFSVPEGGGRAVYGGPIGFDGRPAMTTVNWTTERVEAMTALWLEGVSAEAIATRIGPEVTRSAVLGKLHRLGIVRPQSVRPKTVRPKRTMAPAARKTPKGVVKPTSPVVRSQATLPVTIATEVLPLATLGSVRCGQCRWPIGDPGHGGLPVCGRAVSRGAYCDGHAAIGYQKRRLTSLFALAGLPEG